MDGVKGNKKMKNLFKTSKTMKTLKASYFVPTIEELLHYGQEYEFKPTDDKVWIGLTINEFDAEFVGEIIGNLPNIRIKHLDESDLKELGYDVLINGESCYKNKVNGLVVIQHHPDQVMIQRDRNIQFNGTIKSKSQLERILKLIT